MSKTLYKCATLFACGFAFLHLVSLPVAISYDGFVYIDMADVLGSSRFPQDWNFARTPLFPLALKFAFWLCGRQPLAVILISTTLGLTGVLLLCGALKKTLGAAPAACALVLLSLFPLLVTFEHYALTEVGSACFLMVIAALLLWQTNDRRGAWLRAIALTAVGCLSYYWRQAILSIVPIAALLHGFGSAAVYAGGKNASWLGARAWFRARVPLFAQILMVAVLPFLTMQPWSKYVKDSAMRDVMLRQGMLRQALLPPEHPYVGENRDAYRKAIQDSVFEGGYYSGLRSDLVGQMSEKIYSKPMDGPVTGFYLNLIERYPMRYAAGVARTLVLFSGVKALENETVISKQMIISPVLLGGKVAGAPPELAHIESGFQQNTTASFIQGLLWNLDAAYSPLLIGANVITILGLILAFAFRNIRLSVMCGIPVAYMIACALTLASIDRYAFPVYPLVLANLIAVPLLTVDAWNSRLSRHRSDQ